MMAHKIPSDRESKAGFTLLELLVAMTLLGLLMTMILGGLSFGARAWERAESHSSGADEVRLAQNLLRRELELAYPYLSSSDPLHPRIDFEGTREYMSFLAPASGALQAAGRARIAIRRLEQDGTFALGLSARHELAIRDSHSEDEILLRHLESLEFSYYGLKGRNDPPAWQETWTGETRLPRLVRIRATFRDSGRIWPELIIAPQISADVGCIYDVLTNDCRGR